MCRECCQWQIPALKIRCRESHFRDDRRSFSYITHGRLRFSISRGTSIFLSNVFRTIFMNFLTIITVLLYLSEDAMCIECTDRFSWRGCWLIGIRIFRRLSIFIIIIITVTWTRTFISRIFPTWESPNSYEIFRQHCYLWILDKPTFCTTNICYRYRNMIKFCAKSPRNRAGSSR